MKDVRPTILVVEDEPQIRRFLKASLDAEGYRIVEAGDARRARIDAGMHKPDMALVDLGLPGGDGFLVLERMGAIPRLASIPVIVLTARDPASSEAQAIGLGARRFFQKPVDNDTLLLAIAEALKDA